MRNKKNTTLESYELDVVDYLMKPIPFERFLKAVEKATNQLKVVDSLSSQNNTEQNYLLIKGDRKH